MLLHRICTADTCTRSKYAPACTVLSLIYVVYTSLCTTLIRKAHIHYDTQPHTSNATRGYSAYRVSMFTYFFNEYNFTKLYEMFKKVLYINFTNFFFENLWEAFPQKFIRKLFENFRECSKNF